MIPVSDFIGIRLTDLRGDGSARCAADIDAVMRRQSAMQMLASGNTIDQIEKAIVAVYRDTLNMGASFIAEADPDDPQHHIGALDQFARALKLDVLRQYESDFGRVGLMPMTFEPRRGEVASQLETVRDRVVGDFKFGMAGGRRMTQRPSVQNNVTFTGPVSGSPVIAPGGTINLSVTRSDEGLRALADRMLSELTSATAAEADARRLVEEAKAELAKPKPDRSIVVKLLTRAGNGLLSIGNTALGEVAKAIVTGYAEEYGIIPPTAD
jgi:hypothetical protein